MKKSVLSVIFIILFSSISAQVGNIKGKVIDSKTKQPLVGANVMVKETTFGAATDMDGYFEIKNVPENIYKLSVKFIGYNEHIEPDVRVIRGKTFFTRELELIETPVQSGEVLVSSGYFSDTKETPVSYHSFTKDEIVRAPGAAGDVFRAIDNLPGVTSSGGEFSAFSVRGGAPKDNLILVDNIPFGKVSHFTEASGNDEIEGGRFSIFSTGLIEKADFQAGGFSSKYGGKFASLLDLTVKEGNKENVSMNGSYDLFGWEVNYDGKSFINENTGFRFSARAYDFATILKLVDQEGDGNIKMSDYIAKITTDINPSNKISLIGIYTTETSIRGVSHIYKAEEFDKNGLRNESDDKYLAGLNWRFLPDTKSFINTSLYYVKNDIVQTEGKAFVDKINGARPMEKDVQTKFPLWHYDAIEKRIGAKSDFSYNFNPNFALNLGFQIQQIDYESSQNMFDKDTVYTFDFDEIEENDDKFLVVEPDEFSNILNKKRNEYAGYSELSFSPITNLHFNTGLRYEYDDFIEKTYLSPRFSGTLTLDPETSLNFAAGIYYQIPEMLLVSSHQNNSNLKNEKSIHYIFGVTRYLSDDVKFTAETYYKDLQDLIVRPNSNTNLAVNTGEGYAYGIDLSIVKRFVTNMYGQINYSYSVSKVKEDPQSEYMNSTFNQPHIFNILVGYQFNDHWSITTKWKYASGRPSDEFIIYKDVHNNPNRVRYAKAITSENTSRFDAFHSLNFRVDYRHQFYENLAITAFIDLLNVYGNNNYYREEFNEFNGKNEGEGLQFLPTIGFKLEY